MGQTDRKSVRQEDAELYKPPGLVEDAEHLFQLSLRLHAGVTKMEPGLSTVARFTGPWRALPRIPQWPRIMQMTLAKQ
jgi:hypothetical protein